MIIEQMVPVVLVAGGEGNSPNHRGSGDEERHAPRIYKVSLYKALCEKKTHLLLLLLLLFLHLLLNSLSSAPVTLKKSQ